MIMQTMYIKRHSNYFGGALTVPLYLNEEFTIGELIFTHQKHQVQPKAGLLVGYESGLFFLIE